MKPPKKIKLKNNDKVNYFIKQKQIYYENI